jgi:aromatic ring-opening dioxygenase LigB subunit
MRIVVAPPAPALLPSYASLTDPVPELRAACRSAVGWLGPSVRVLADDARAFHVGETLVGARSDYDARDLLVMANGSARRSEKAPGHLDPRAAGYDDWLRQLLRLGDLQGLASLDVDEGEELLATGLRSLTVLARQLADRGVSVREVQVDHDADPYGVQYWVVRWQCVS